MKIILDANTIVQDFRLKGVDAKLLASYLNRTRAKLLIPLVVIEESVRKYQDLLSEGIKKFQKSSKQLTYLLGRDLESNQAFDVSAEVESYRKDHSKDSSCA